MLKAPSESSLVLLAPSVATTRMSAWLVPGNSVECSDRLVAFEQEVEPAFRHFIIIASNYSNNYGNPLKVIPYSSVIATGEKNLLAMFWRKGGDYMGVKYVLHPASEQLSMSWQISNNCWQAPR